MKRTARRRRRRLAVELSAALVAKLVALIVIWNMWFADGDRLRVDADGVADALYAAPASHPPESKGNAARP
jgi:uncharacterized membrane protein